MEEDKKIDVNMEENKEQTTLDSTRIEQDPETAADCLGISPVWTRPGYSDQERPQLERTPKGNRMPVS